VEDNQLERLTVDMQGQENKKGLVLFQSLSLVYS